FVFFFSSRRRHTRFSRDWSSDVCSSDLMIHCQAAATRETTPFGFSRQWRRLRALRAAAAMWLAARNLVSWMIDEARESAVWSDEIGRASCRERVEGGGGAVAGKGGMWRE